MQADSPHEMAGVEVERYRDVSPPATPRPSQSPMESTPMPSLMVNPLAEDVALPEEQGVSGVQPPEWVWWSKVPAGGTSARPADSDHALLTDFAKPSPLCYRMWTLDSPGLSDDSPLQVSRWQLIGRKFDSA